MLRFMIVAALLAVASGCQRSPYFADDLLVLDGKVVVAADASTGENVELATGTGLEPIEGRPREMGVVTMRVADGPHRGKIVRLRNSAVRSRD